jgi:biopolymer transport protein ExbB
MFELFRKGGPVMWPLLLTSIVSLSVVIERLVFIAREKARRKPELVDKILDSVEAGNIDQAIETGSQNKDFVARALAYALAHRERSFAQALLRAANQELKRFSQGLSVLDTVITLAPLLGLFGTVVGMIHAFGLLGAKELEAPSVITGGIAEALIATAFGLIIAIVALIPFNYLNSRLEEARHEIEDASNHLELLLANQNADTVARR